MNDYPLPDPSTPLGELFLGAAEWSVQFGKCWAHRRMAENCGACRGELSQDELAASVELAKQDFSRWLAAGRSNDLGLAIHPGFDSIRRYARDLVLVAIEETNRRSVQSPQDQDLNRKVTELESLADACFPDPFDVYEDKLAEKMGIARYPIMSLSEWRRVRVAAIEACGEFADAKAAEVEAELDETDWPHIDRRDSGHE